jgi:hypothetical protein
VYRKYKFSYIFEKKIVAKKEKRTGDEVFEKKSQTQSLETLAIARLFSFISVVSLGN